MAALRELFEGAEHQAGDRMFARLAVLANFRLDGAYGSRLRAVVLLVSRVSSLVIQEQNFRM